MKKRILSCSLVVIAILGIVAKAQAAQIQGTIDQLQVQHLQLAGSPDVTATWVRLNPSPGQSQVTGCLWDLLVIDDDPATGWDEHLFPLLLSAKTANLEVSISYSTGADVGGGVLCSIDQAGIK